MGESPCCYHNSPTSRETIDREFTGRLASWLTQRILVKHREEMWTWSVKWEKLPDDYFLKDIFKNGTFPNATIIDQFGDQWHKLLIIPIFEIPETVDPSEMLDDKSHSLTRSEVLAHLRTGDKRPVPSHWVLLTSLNKCESNPRQFLSTDSIDEDYLIIRLKGKEREMKNSGWCSSLMSDQIRDYFILTEKLIKDFYLPYFTSITMADTQVETKKKIFQYINLHGSKQNKVLHTVNHLDYEKWNNYQRYELIYDAFKVMGQFFGLENLLWGPGEPDRNCRREDSE